MPHGNKGLVLPDGPRQVFEAVEPILSGFFSGYRIGGGMVLAAYWRHRHSTDVGLFADASDYRSVVESRGSELESELRSRVPGIDPERTWVEDENTVLYVGDHEVSLLPGDRLCAVPESPDRVAGTGVEVESVEEILSKKIRYRMLGSATYLIRDLYDLVFARLRVPDLLAKVLDRIGPDRLLQVAGEMGSVRAFEQGLIDPKLSGTDLEFRDEAARILRVYAERKQIPPPDPDRFPGAPPAGPASPGPE